MADAEQHKPGKPPRRTRRRRVAGLLVVLALLAAAFGEIGISRSIRSRLTTLVAERLDGARLEADTLAYVPPYGVRADGVRLIGHDAHGTPVEVIYVEHIDLRLAGLPARDKPLLIESLSARGPAVRFARRDGELLTPAKLLRPKPTATTKPSKKLSDVLRLRRLTIQGGRVVFEEDGSVPGRAPESVWAGIDVDVRTVATSISKYEYQLAAHDAPLIDLDSAGSIDVDDWQLGVKTLAMTARVRDASPELSMLPAPVREIFERYGVRGSLRVDVEGDVSLRSPSGGRGRATIELTDAAARLPQWGLPIDHVGVKLVFRTEADSNDSTLRVEQFHAVSGDAALRVDRAIATLRPGQNTWEVERLRGSFEGQSPVAPSTMPTTSVATTAPNFAATIPPMHRLRVGGRVDFTAAASGALRRTAGSATMPNAFELVAYPRELSIQPEALPRPVEHINGGPVHVVSNVLKFENLVGHYGDDVVELSSARIPLSGLPGALRLEEIMATVTFNEPRPEYPAALQKILDQLNPGGACTIGGWFSVGRSATSAAEDKSRSPDCDLMISCDDASLAVTEWRFPLTHVRADSRLSKSEFHLTNLDADSLGGHVTAKGKILLTKPFRYEGDGTAREIDLATLFKTITPPDSKPLEVSGKGLLNARFSGAGPGGPKSPLDTLKASGECVVTQGDLWKIPVFDGTVANSKVATETLTAGDAAAVFDIADRTIRFRRAVLNAPALGLQGSGTVGFDGDLDLKVIAAPLADWKDKMQETGIPIVSDLAGEALGGLQKLVNSATKKLLYEFHVTGKSSHPEFKTIPAPILTEGSAVLFGKMVGGLHADAMLEWLRKESQPRTPDTEETTSPSR